MKELTQRELTTLEILWEIEKGFVNDVLDMYPEPKPPYTTISSIIRILETKGYVSHKAYGKTHEYFPIVSRIKYKKYVVKDLVKNFFGGSLNNVVSFMAEEDELSEKEIKEISELIDQYKKDQS
ncbi:MAG: CopY family transcriptional repressor [Flammeovirgaceae bacterium]|nr:CopY family transcriptional repressor [Flammeovirgaceae bacterium]MBE63795.1 CopY family transcriptional repressor [Flammeovirgaceae bacterium]MBR08440.1 CopY family transcriptional repressor [Rickettsiales bacterium]HCX24466.1 CopY family transcriptional repressor [Cytophagales bacterium]|tara:strand:+ start:89 stop:460 length:372 start_codon:yes stop_codon:yes gene_type:complete